MFRPMSRPAAPRRAGPRILRRVTNETAPTDPGRDDAITPDEAPAAEPELPAEPVTSEAQETAADEAPATEAVEVPVATGDSRERLRALQDELRREREQVGKRREQDQRRRR
jgi:hypothetical protein